MSAFISTDFFQCHLYCCHKNTKAKSFTKQGSGLLIKISPLQGFKSKAHKFSTNVTLLTELKQSRQGRYIGRKIKQSDS